jgi:hypothetical protein
VASIPGDVLPIMCFIHLQKLPPAGSPKLTDLVAADWQMKGTIKRKLYETGETPSKKSKKDDTK